MVNVEKVDTENPSLHWKYIECENKVVIDLGCGRWEKVEHRDQSWPTTPEYLVQLGASKVYAFDIDKNEIEWYKNNICPISPKIKPFCVNLNNLEIIKKIYSDIKPDVVKCDIELNEALLLELSDEEFSSVELYAIETHNDTLYNNFLKKFKQLNYTITGLIELTHAPPMKAIFAKRNNV